MKALAASFLSTETTIADRETEQSTPEMGTAPEGAVSVARLSRAPDGYAARRTSPMSTLSLAFVFCTVEAVAQPNRSLAFTAPSRTQVAPLSSAPSRDALLVEAAGIEPAS